MLPSGACSSCARWIVTFRHSSVYETNRAWAIFTLGSISRDHGIDGTTYQIGSGETFWRLLCGYGFSICFVFRFGMGRLLYFLSGGTVAMVSFGWVFFSSAIWEMVYLDPVALIWVIRDNIGWYLSLGINSVHVFQQRKFRD